MRRALLATALVAAAAVQASDDSPGSAAVSAEAAELRIAFATEVSPSLTVPASDLAAETALLDATLERHRVTMIEPQIVALVDRSPQVQAMILLLGSPATGWHAIGATPVSTGLPGRFDHFETPLGVFEHSLANPDFRAEGTKNALGIRGYGRRGMRVYDFGWAQARKGWGDHAIATMRMQMHATDPDVLERRLGSAQSKGCIRIPATLNAFVDRRSLLDAAYDEAAAGGARFWVLRDDRVPAPYAGRYLVVVDSARDERAAWAPWPATVPRPQPRATSSRAD
jgi:hypothetical protein